MHEDETIERGVRDAAGPVWTLRQFSGVAGKPWFAMQRQNDAEVVQQFTGYQHGSGPGDDQGHP